MENTKKTQALKRLEAKMDELSAELGAVAYALQLVSEKHDSAADMVQNVPQNIYIEEWKAEERHTAQKLKQLKALYDKLGAEQSKVCAQIDAYYMNY